MNFKFLSIFLELSSFFLNILTDPCQSILGDKNLPWFQFWFLWSISESLNICLTIPSSVYIADHYLPPGHLDGVVSVASGGYCVLCSDWKHVAGDRGYAAVMSNEYSALEASAV